MPRVLNYFNLSRSELLFQSLNREKLLALIDSCGESIAEVEMSLSTLLLCRQSVPSPAAILSHRTQPKQPKAGLGTGKAVQRETSHHHIILIYKSM